MSPFADVRRRRPVARAAVHEVDGGMHQARCVCRWHGRRRHDPADAQRDADEHVAACGQCVDLGRDFLESCSCGNCARRRAVRAHFGEPS